MQHLSDDVESTVRADTPPFNRVMQMLSICSAVTLLGRYKSLQVRSVEHFPSSLFQVTSLFSSSAIGCIGGGLWDQVFLGQLCRHNNEHCTTALQHTIHHKICRIRYGGIVWSVSLDSCIRSAFDDCTLYSWKVIHKRTATEGCKIRNGF